MGNIMTNPLAELAARPMRRGCRAAVHGTPLTTSLGARGGRVVAGDGRLSRPGGERGHVPGGAGAEPATAERAVPVLRQLARRS